MLELLYVGMLHDDETFEIQFIDTLSHPLDFFESLVDTSFLQKDSEEGLGLVRTEFFCCVGSQNEVELVDEMVSAEIRSSFKSIIEDGGLSLPAYGFQDARLEAFFDLYSSCVFGESRIAFPVKILFDSFDDAPAILCYSLGENPDEEERILYEITLARDGWFEMEIPKLVNRQVITQSFALNAVRGKRIIAPVYDAVLSQWVLLLEGSRVVPLCMGQTSSWQKFSYEKMTEANIATILKNPAYAFGKFYEPLEILEEWSDAFFYQMACISLIRPLSRDELEKAYLCFLAEIEARFTYADVEPIVSVDDFLQSALVFINNVIEFLKGCDESYLSKDFVATTSQRLYHLCALNPIIEGLFGEDTMRLRSSVSFCRSDFQRLLDQCDQGSDNERGLALEDLAAYLFECLPEWKIVGRRVRTYNGEIDLFLCNVSLDQSMWNLGSVLLVECKNRRSAAGIREIRTLFYMMQDKGSSSGLLISLGGFTSVAKREVLQLALRGANILLIDREDLDALGNQRTPSDLIEEKRVELEQITENDLRILGA